MALILLYTFKTSIMSFELFVLQVFFLSMAGLILYMNRNMLGKAAASLSFLSVIKPPKHFLTNRI